MLGLCLLLAVAMLSRDPAVLRALSALSSTTLATLDALMSEVVFFQDPDPEAWRGHADLHFRVDAGISPTEWVCSAFSPPSSTGLAVTSAALSHRGCSQSLVAGGSSLC